MDPAQAVGVEAVEELVGLEAMEVEPPVDLVAVDIYMYPRIMVQAEEDMALSLAAWVAPATATAAAAAGPVALALLPLAMASASARVVAADSRLTEKLAPSPVPLPARALQVLSLFPI